MDVGCTNGWRMDDVVSASEIMQCISSRYPISRMDANAIGEVAQRWCYDDGGGEIGVIASVTQAFCGDCSRVRLSTDGKLYTCLFAANGMDLRQPLRAGMSEAELRRMAGDLWRQRQDRYSQLRHLATDIDRKKVEMSYIGG
jgi:cyclic pyranopterin phosphate synthase